MLFSIHEIKTIRITLKIIDVHVLIAVCVVQCIYIFYCTRNDFIQAPQLKTIELDVKLSCLL